MILCANLILGLMLFLSMNIETKILDVVDTTTKNTSQAFFKDITNLGVRSIIFLFEENENLQDFFKQLHQLLIPIYAITVNKSMDLNYNEQHEIIRDNAKLFLVYKNEEAINDTVDFIMKLNFWKRRNNITFLSDDRLDSTAITNMFQTCFKNWITNVVLVPLNQDSVVYALDPYSPNLTRLQNSLWFKDQFVDLRGRTLNISMFHEPAYARKEGDHFLGRDGRMVETIMKAMKATYNYILPDDDETFGFFNTTHSSGAAKDVIQNVTQANFNCRLQVKDYHQVEFTYFHDREDLVALIPKTGKQKTLLEIIPPLVLPTLAVLSIFIFLFLATNTKHTYCYILLTVVLIITGKSIPEIRIRYFRVVYMSTMVVVFFLTTIICCRVTSFSTVPEFQNEIQTLNQLVQTDYNVVTTEKFSGQLSLSLDDEIRRHIMSKLEVIDSRWQIDNILKCKERVIICKTGIAKLALDKGGETCYTQMKQVVLPSVDSYLVGYGSPILTRVNRIIKRVTQSGLNGFWKKAKLNVEKEEETHTRISLNFLMIAFKVYLGGILTAAIVFALEVIGKRIKEKGRKL